MKYIVNPVGLPFNSAQVHLPMSKNREQRRAYLREYQRRWVAKNRAEYMSSAGPCVVCGSDDNLEVDHINPDLKVDHRIWSWKLDRRLKELEKCQILCKSCHLKKTIAERAPPHGHNSRYRSGCRCDECRKAHATIAREYRSRSNEVPTTNIPSQLHSSHNSTTI
jgi:5-methylcytosine-specific restriction endonuclease McrA